MKQAEDAAVEVEVLAQSIVSISEGIKKLRATRLKDNALFLLIQHAAPTDRTGRKPSQSDIRAVFDGIESLRRTYLKTEVNGRR